MLQNLTAALMKYIHKKRLVIFFKKYASTKEKAKNLMGTGDVNAYLKQLIETERTKKRAITYLVKSV